MSARHKKHRQQRTLPGISSTLPKQKIRIGEMQIAGGLSLEIALKDHGQGPRIVIAKLGKAGRTVGSLSIEADNGRALASMIEAAANVAGQQEGQTAGPPPWT